MMLVLPVSPKTRSSREGLPSPDTTTPPGARAQSSGCVRAHVLMRSDRRSSAARIGIPLAARVALMVCGAALIGQAIWIHAKAHARAGSARTRIRRDLGDRP